MQLLHLNFVAVVLLVLPIAGSCANIDPISSNDAQISGADNSTLSKLFDFQMYKRLFNKSYSSLSEELARQRLFLSRALEAFISNVRYKHWEQPYYLSVNDMSDETEKELHKMDNKFLDQLLEAGVFEGSSGDAESGLPEVILNDVADVQREPLKHVEAYEEAQSAQDVLSVLMQGESGASVLREIASEMGVRLSDEAAHRVSPHVQKEPCHKPKNQEPERRAAKMVAGQQPVKFWEVGWPRERPKAVKRDGPKKGIFDKLKGLFKEPPFEERPARVKPVEWDDAQKADEVFFDLRATNCFTTPRRQYQCGSCYAFATVAIFEWLYCMKTGQQLEFSEQYLIDCGQEYVQDLVGCSGGSPTAAAHFVRNFGLELLEKYPYRRAVHQCPYHKDFDPEATGHIRFNFSQGLIVHSDLWPDILESGPLLAPVMLAPHFKQYRGGVHGHGCDRSGGMHAMVLVGHGRERGQEYWLLRNSHGTLWGEQGYYKLAKRANCMFGNYAVFYQSRQTVQEKDVVKQNERYDELFVRNHHENLGAV